MSKRRGGRRRNPDAKRNQTTRAGRGIGTKTDPAVTPELMARRAEQVGEGNAMNQRAGYSLGRLLLMGHITEDMHDAGQRFLARWSRWAQMAEAGSRWPKAQDFARVPGRAPADEDEAEWRRVSGEVYGIYRSLSAIERAAVEAVVIDDVLPPAMLDRPAAVEVVKRALSILSSHYIRRPVAQAA